MSEWKKGLDATGQQNAAEAARFEQYELLHGSFEHFRRQFARTGSDGPSSAGFQMQRSENFQGSVEQQDNQASGHIPVSQGSASSAMARSGTSTPTNQKDVIMTDTSAKVGSQNLPSANRPRNANGRSLQEAIEIRAERRREIERRCMELSPPISTSTLTHMDAFQNALLISLPFDDRQWDILKPRLLAQRSVAEQREYAKALEAPSLQDADRQRIETEQRLARENADHMWSELKVPSRDKIRKYAEEFVHQTWSDGHAVTKGTASKFAAEVICHVRQRFDEAIAQEDRMLALKGTAFPQDAESLASRKLKLEDMKWTFEEFVKPHTQRFGKDLFLCRVCDTNEKLFSFEAMIQHFAAKHTTSLSLGASIVYWKADWPPYPPFDPQPNIPWALGDANLALLGSAQPLIQSHPHSPSVPPSVASYSSNGRKAKRAPKTISQLGRSPQPRGSSMSHVFSGMISRSECGNNPPLRAVTGSKTYLPPSSVRSETLRGTASERYTGQAGTPIFVRGGKTQRHGDFDAYRSPALSYASAYRTPPSPAQTWSACSHTIDHLPGPGGLQPETSPAAVAPRNWDMPSYPSRDALPTKDRSLGLEYQDDSRASSTIPGTIVTGTSRMPHHQTTSPYPPSLATDHASVKSAVDEFLDNFDPHTNNSSPSIAPSEATARLSSSNAGLAVTGGGRAAHSHTQGGPTLHGEPLNRQQSLGRLTSLPIRELETYPSSHTETVGKYQNMQETSPVLQPSPMIERYPVQLEEDWVDRRPTETRTFGARAESDWDALSYRTSIFERRYVRDQDGRLYEQIRELSPEQHMARHDSTRQSEDFHYSPPPTSPRYLRDFGRAQPQEDFVTYGSSAAEALGHRYEVEYAPRRGQRYFSPGREPHYVYHEPIRSDMRADGRGPGNREAAYHDFNPRDWPATRTLHTHPSGDRPHSRDARP
jgi:hypothetical protein